MRVRNPMQLAVMFPRLLKGGLGWLVQAMTERVGEFVLRPHTCNCSLQPELIIITSKESENARAQRKLHTIVQAKAKTLVSLFNVFSIASNLTLM